MGDSQPEPGEGGHLALGPLSISQPIRGGDEACATKKGYTGTCKCFTCLKKKKVLVTSLGMRVWVKEHSLKVSPQAKATEFLALPPSISQPRTQSTTPASVRELLNSIQK